MIRFIHSSHAYDLRFATPEGKGAMHEVYESTLVRGELGRLDDGMLVLHNDGAGSSTRVSLRNALDQSPPGPAVVKPRKNAPKGPVKHGQHWKQR